MRPEPRRPDPGTRPARAESGSALFVVLAMGVVIALLLMGWLTISGRNRADSVKNLRHTKEFYLADAGFNYVQAEVSQINRYGGGVNSVDSMLSACKAAGWQSIAIDASTMGYFKLDSFSLVTAPVSVTLRVLGSTSAGGMARTQSVSGVLRVPSLARYARYVEGPSTLNYANPGTTVDGEVLVAGPINLAGDSIHFTRLVSTGQTIVNPTKGIYDFGYRLNQDDIPTLNDIHINTWDNQAYTRADSVKTYYYKAKYEGGIVLMEQWSGLNGTKACAQDKTGPCDTLFASCFDDSTRSRRASAVVAGSAVAIDLSKITISAGNVTIPVRPVVFDSGAIGGKHIIFGYPARYYTKSLAAFAPNAVLYFPGDIYLTGHLNGLSLTIASGDDVFFYGKWVGPDPGAVDGAGNPVTLGVLAQDRAFIHESASRRMTVRAAVLAENDEIFYVDTLHVANWRYGYDCRRDVFAVNMADSVSFPKYFQDHFIWDDQRQPQSGFGREPDEECVPSGGSACTNLDDFGFIALPFVRNDTSANWRLTFDGSLITRQPGSVGPSNNCNEGWDCTSDPGRVSWNYDINLGVNPPPKFAPPKVDDKIKSQVVGYKRRSE